MQAGVAAASLVRLGTIILAEGLREPTRWAVGLSLLSTVEDVQDVYFFFSGAVDDDIGQSRNDEFKSALYIT